MASEGGWRATLTSPPQLLLTLFKVGLKNYLAISQPAPNHPLPTEHTIPQSSATSPSANDVHPSSHLLNSWSSFKTQFKHLPQVGFRDCSNTFGLLAPFCH